MVTENLSTLKIHKLTKAQYEREKNKGALDENALYLTPDDDIVKNTMPVIDLTEMGLGTVGIGDSVYVLPYTYSETIVEALKTGVVKAKFKVNIEGVDLPTYGVLNCFGSDDMQYYQGSSLLNLFGLVVLFSISATPGRQVEISAVPIPKTSDVNGMLTNLIGGSY